MFARHCGLIPPRRSEARRHGIERDPLVRLDHISKQLGTGATRVDALRDVSLTVYPRQVVAQLGPSGSGRTTPLNVIGCILGASSGSMALDGERVIEDGRWLRSDLRRLRLDKIGFIFQFHNLIPFLDATDNVALVLRLAVILPRFCGHPC
ncbi:ATP-binding cassette domain-containing protein [Xanthobacter sp. DSM 24535]|uniref:ATP-binding cassette domain-containing protein n=1 Tax=Roseixanthobacter psychrophilus TaxID=3119917 RepID=UPI00372C93E8